MRASTIPGWLQSLTQTAWLPCWTSGKGTQHDIRVASKPTSESDSCQNNTHCSPSSKGRAAPSHSSAPLGRPRYLSLESTDTDPTARKPSQSKRPLVLRPIRHASGVHSSVGAVMRRADGTTASEKPRGGARLRERKFCRFIVGDGAVKRRADTRRGSRFRRGGPGLVCRIPPSSAGVVWEAHWEASREGGKALGGMHVGHWR
ncbi:hypothetical protein LX32DRAFT_336962 [Colletotrichum zoysiae]|uniref:Uncharacterized protein n=1 Tax=Colletotrichum zoysiae TaxID=1216348 RepID=A0AAD9HLU9_9PEZI|nr:hypothetical protein LX32DRAFT_336962 [Colletotrichum zoysiae]